MTSTKSTALRTWRKAQKDMPSMYDAARAAGVSYASWRIAEIGYPVRESTARKISLKTGVPLKHFTITAWGRD